MYDARELREARADYASGLPGSIVIVRDVEESNGAGGVKTTAVKVETLPGTLFPLRQPRIGYEGDHPVVLADFEVHLGHLSRAPETFNVEARDVLTVNGVLFRVVSTDKGKTQALYLRVTCLQVL